jgi:hypothetical protein
MPETRQSVERKLAISRKQLAILEEKIALYTELEAPVHLVTQRDMEREEIAHLEALLESGKLPEGDERTVSEREKPGGVIRATIFGDVSGQVAVGTGITQTQTVGAARPQGTEADLAELRQVPVSLKAKGTAENPDRVARY